MPTRIQADHYLLHFGTYATDTSVSASVRRRAATIVTLVAASPRNAQTMLDYLIAVFGPRVTPDDLIIKSVLAEFTPLGRAKASSIARRLEDF